jgi:hypothetical protein
MNKKILIPTFAAVLMTSMVRADVAVFLDPVQYKNPQALVNAPNVNMGAYAPLNEWESLGAGARNPLIHQWAENTLIQFHDHQFPSQQLASLDGSPLEACRNYQMEQLGIALSEDGSPLKKYLKDYTKTFGGKVQLATEVQVNSSSDMQLISSRGAVHPELDVVEGGAQGVGLNFTPVVETYVTHLNPTPQVSCKILSAQEITVIATSQLAILQSKHLQKLKGPDSFNIKDLVSVVSSNLQTVPRFGYPAHMDLQLEKIASDGTPKLEDATPQNAQASSTAVAGGAN